MTAAESKQRELALAAAGQAAEAAAELVRFAREGDWLHGPFHPDVEVVEKLLDAAKLAIEVQDGAGVEDPDGDRNQVLGAIEKYLSGWAG